MRVPKVILSENLNMNIEGMRRDGIDALYMNSMGRQGTGRFGWLRVVQQLVRVSGPQQRDTESSIWREVNIYRIYNYTFSIV